MWVRRYGALWCWKKGLDLLAEIEWHGLDIPPTASECRYDQLCETHLLVLCEPHIKFPVKLALKYDFIQSIIQMYSSKSSVKPSRTAKVYLQHLPRYNDEQAQPNSLPRLGIACPDRHRAQTSVLQPPDPSVPFAVPFGSQLFIVSHGLNK